MGKDSCPFCAEPIAGGATKCDSCGERLDGPPPDVPAKSNTGLIIGVVVAVCVGGVCLVGILATLLMPALMKAKSKANRTKCSNNLRQAALAMIMYADDRRFFPHVGPTRSLDGDVTTSDSPKITRSLIWYGYHDDPGAFICPESYDLAFGAASPGAPTAGVGSPRAWFWQGNTIPESELSPFVDGQPDPTLDTTDELSYGWTRRALNSNVRATALLSADRARRSDPSATDVLAGNHTDGWNVGRADGTVNWTPPQLAGELTSTDTSSREAGFLSIEDPSSP